MPFDLSEIRSDFPILSRQVNGYPLVYLDNAATSQTPKPVVDTIADYYNSYNANIHRGVHSLSQEATEKYEGARVKISDHINAKENFEIIFTSGTTHSINLVANGFSDKLGPGDEIIVSEMEHHSNIVPWQMLCEKTAAKLKVLPITDSGELDMEQYEKLLGPNTKMVFVNHISNALGTINPIKEIINKAHDTGALVLVDGAQACPHLIPDVQALNVDFYTGSAHKMCGPTGIGFLYGKEALLREMPPFMGGGEMISEVTFEKTTYADLPHKFEAGTPNVCGAIAFAEAIDYMNGIGFNNIKAHEDQLLHYVTAKLQEIPGLIIYGPKDNKAPVISFNIEGVHSYDIGTILDKMGIAVRTGHHCAQPIMDRYEIPGTVRASFAFYNSFEEADRLVEGVKKAVSMLS